MNQRKAGVVLSYLSTCIQSIVALVYVPMLLHYLTQAQYGIYQLMGSVIGYLAIIEFGLANTTTRYVARALARNDAAQMQLIINSSHTIYSVLAIVLLCLGSVFYSFIDVVYAPTLSPVELHIAKKIYLIMLLNIIVLIQGNIFTAVINAYERFIFVRGLNLLKTCCMPLLVWAVLSWRANVVYVVLVQSVCIWAVLIANYWYCKSKLNISFSLQLKRIPIFKELMGFSFFIFLHMLMDQVYLSSGQLILGAISGPSSVTIYAIAIQISMFAIFLPTTMGGVFLPKLTTSMAMHTNLDETNALFCKLGRLQFMLLMLLVTGFGFLGRTFLLLWVGPGYEMVYWIVLVFLGGYLLDVTQNIGISALQAMKKHAFRAYVYVVMTALNFILSILLAKKYGAIGCAVSTAICLFLGSGVAINWYYWYVGINIKRFFVNMGKLSLPIILANILIGLLFFWWPLHLSVFNFVFHGIILTSIYGAILWNMGLNEYEKDLVRIPLKQGYSFLANKTGICRKLEH